MTVLVGKTRIGTEGPERTQYFGVTEAVDLARGVGVRRADNHELAWLPPDLRAFERARPGVYTLAGSGEEVIDPDFISVGTVNRPD